ncbi:unnamed protein product [Cochlearia groenlandica]
MWREDKAKYVYMANVTGKCLGLSPNPDKRSESWFRRSKIGARKNIAWLEPPEMRMFRIKHRTKHMIVATLSTVGIHAAPSSDIFSIALGLDRGGSALLHQPHS